MAISLLKLNDLTRVGRNYDGGYVLSDQLLKKSSALLSFGINDDWSFEEDFCEKAGKPCYGFDFSIHEDIFRKRGWEQVKYFFGDIIKRRTIDWGRWGEAKKHFALSKSFHDFFKGDHVFLSYGIDKTTHGEFKKLDDILNENLSGKEDIFLKADIEGYEYEIVQDVVSNASRFCGLAFEVHLIHSKRKEFEGFMDCLQQEFYVYHIHANNYGSIQKMDSFPDAIEISCIRKDMVDHPVFYEGLSHLPIENLDYPNNPSAPDFKW
jgi:hypothetical protein